MSIFVSDEKQYHQLDPDLTPGFNKELNHNPHFSAFQVGSLLHYINITMGMNYIRPFRIVSIHRAERDRIAINWSHSERQ